MSPRPYRRGQRQEATEQTRARILAAARDLLMAPTGFATFSIDAVARQADVARMTVYYQFGSRVGLLEALSDDLAARGALERLPEAFEQPDPRAALLTFIALFGHFWATDRLVTRRLRGLATLDPDFERVIQARDERRRTGLSVIVRRLSAHGGVPTPDAVDGVIDVLQTLTSFESFDTLAGSGRRPEEVVPLIQQLAQAALQIRPADTPRAPA